MPGHRDNLGEQIFNKLDRFRRQAQQVGSTVLLISGPFDQATIGKDSDVPQRSCYRNHRGCARACDADILVFAVVDIKIENDIPSRIGENIASEPRRHQRIAAAAEAVQIFGHFGQTLFGDFARPLFSVITRADQARQEADKCRQFLGIETKCGQVCIVLKDMNVTHILPPTTKFHFRASITVLCLLLRIFATIRDTKPYATF